MTTPNKYLQTALIRVIKLILNVVAALQVDNGMIISIAAVQETVFERIFQNKIK